ncbi:Gfo/Idh/MocA family protein [Litoreibacter roseus]|uniref:NADH-dependent dehydrogenase n=1 Tax=Litoreibacter roseus TaxID=2601869 RepID=A0A6N6JFG1_9RHOB|nr:Gfo/Idh/MocA family oxidoreductase [Litoreibacter roseus]GFE63952.1 NADH-dependent dehydrogenase [Litoreibacter roseus]
MTLRVACLGAGYFAKFHYDAWDRLERAQGVGACDQDISRAQETGWTAFEDLSKMLSDTKPDILDIVVPPQGHRTAIETALSHPLKAIICQKPFCTTLTEAREMCAMAEEADVPLIIHENFRFQPWYRHIKKTIESGALGDVLQVTFRLRPGDGQGPDAYLERQPYFQTMPRLLIHETGVHFIDVFRYLLGEPVAAYADLRQVNPVLKGEDAGLFTLDFASGARALFDGNRLLDHGAENCRITLGEALVEGTDGTLELRGDGSVQIRKFGEAAGVVSFPAQDWPGFGGDCVHALCDHVLDGLHDGAPFENLARTYLSILELEETLYRSASEGRKIALD